MDTDKAMAAVDSFAWSTWKDKFAAIYEPLYLAMVTSQANRVMQPKKAKGPFRPQDPFTKKFIREYIATRVTQIDETTRDWVRETVAGAVESEEAVTLTSLAIELSDRVEESRAFAPARAAMIARTEVATAWNHGAVLGYKQDGVEKVEVSDGDGDEECEAVDGEIWTLEEALANPLAHPNAVMEGTEVVPVGEVLVGYRARWNGPVRRLTTSRGHCVTIGPNHPVLTARGWVKAKHVRVGDHVITNGVADPCGPNEDLNNVPSVIEKVFEALWSVADHARIVSAPTHFHGDGNSCEGDVEVVRANGELACECETTAGQQFTKSVLMLARAEAEALPCGGALGAHAESVALPTPSSMCLGHVRRVSVAGAQLDTVLTEPLVDHAIADAEFARELASRFAGPITIDQITNVTDVTAFVGHAFDLETVYHAYFASGILVSNCVRAFSPVVEDDEA